MLSMPKAIQLAATFPQGLFVPQSLVLALVHSPWSMLHKIWNGADHGLGSIWICDKRTAKTADWPGCSINCANKPVRYPRGVRPYWLHIAFHGLLDNTTWQDRVLGALRLVMETLLGGQDVLVHCAQGHQIGKECVRGFGCFVVWT